MNPRPDEIWIVNTRWQRPKTWRDWLAAVGFVAIGIAVIALAVVVASTVFVVAVVIGVIAAAVGVMSYLFSRPKPKHGPSDYKRIENAPD
jgi:uncharacterized membrane protein HdeD (DUF308 family)